MFAVVGLGNPGQSYEHTRHNIGFMAVDVLNDRCEGQFKKGKGPYFLSKIRIAQDAVLLIKPTTYMNLSGQAVQHVLHYFKIDDLSKLLIVLDDFHLPFGTLRARPSGSAAGQKGLKSILNIVGSDLVPRLRLGIGNESGETVGETSDYVLSQFKGSEKKDLPHILQHAADAVEAYVDHGISYTMNNYNKDFLTT